MPHPKNGKKQLDLQMWNFMSNLLKNKIDKNKYSRSLLDTENCCCGNHQPYNFFRFFPISGHLQTTEENQNW